jgi:hypothetical protein
MPYPWTFESFVNGKNYYLPSGTYYIGDVFPDDHIAYAITIFSRISEAAAKTR